jgi:hypothetical protein
MSATSTKEISMTKENSLVGSALRMWKSNVDRAGKLFAGLSGEQLQQEVAPRKNRLIYIWGHLAAVNDALLPLLGLGERLHPELDAIFLSSPDRSVKDLPSAKELQRIWTEIHDTLWIAFSKLNAEQWQQRHTAVSAEDFVREPHRNRFAVLLSRTTHISYHLGQAVLGEKASRD